METIKKRSADIIFSGGSVITMEDPIVAQHVDLALADGYILAIGDPGELSHLKEPETRIIDLKNKTLMPGLIDSHNHMVLFGEYMLAVDVSPSKVNSLEKLLAKLKDRAAETPQGEWVKAWGYDDSLLNEKRHPMKKDLDTACPNHPVRVMRTDMHTMAVNSMALKMAGITSKTPDPEGGKIGRDEQGEPNGLLFEPAAMNLVNRLIPQPSPSDCASALKVASEFYVRQGVTMVCEAGAGWGGNLNEAAGFQIAWQNGDLIPRVSMGLMEQTYKLFSELESPGLFTGFGNQLLWIGPAKFVADGGIGPRTAALSQPYEGSIDCGFMNEDPKSLTERMEQAHRAGFQISVHAIGDLAIDMIISAFESILSRFPRPHRHRIEHVALCRPDFLHRMSRLGLNAVVQPALLYYMGESYIKNIGQERIKYTVPIKSMLKNGIIVAGSSDRPAIEGIEGNPWIGIWSAVHRTTLTGKTMNRDECLSVPEALKLYTVNGAYVNFAEHRLGSLSPGKIGDVIVLDENPLEIDPAKLKDVQVNMTVIHGRVVYERS